MGWNGHNNISLGALIRRLENEPAGKRVKLGLGWAHSYRRYYEDLSFTPTENVTVGEMLAHARAALGETMTGYKGGEFAMDDETDCWLAEYGRTGDELTPRLLDYMLADEVES